MASRACKHRKGNGQACGAPPLRDKEYCLRHSPEHAEAVAEGRRIGGMRRKREGTVATAYDFEGLGTVDGIRRLVEIAVFDTLGQDNTIGRARALAYLAQTAIGLLEKGEWEERLAAVEQSLGPRLVKQGKRR